MNTERNNNPDNLLRLKDEILARWQQLPAEHQATYALVLLDTVMKGEWGDWLKSAIGIRWPSETQQGERVVWTPNLSREDLNSLELGSDEVAKLTDDDLK